MRQTAATGHRDHRGTYEPCGPKRTLVDQAGSSTAGSRDIRGYSHQCHLPESGGSLSALWFARYPETAGMSANESLES
jgi:hypothetical protein